MRKTRLVSDLKYPQNLHQIFLRLSKREKNRTALESAENADNYLKDRTYYRFFNEITPFSFGS